MGAPAVCASMPPGVFAFMVVGLMCVRAFDPSLKNANKPCWFQCSKRQGPCSFCGSGYCCRRGFADTSNGCDPTIGTNPHHHLCAAAPVVTCFPTSAEFSGGTLKFKNCSGCSYQPLSKQEFLEAGAPQWQADRSTDTPFGGYHHRRLPPLPVDHKGVIRVKSINGCVGCKKGQAYAQFWGSAKSTEPSPGFCIDVNKWNNKLLEMSASIPELPVKVSNMYLSKAGEKWLQLWRGSDKAIYWMIACRFLKIVACRKDSNQRNQCVTHKKIWPVGIGVDGDSKVIATKSGLKHWYKIEEAPYTQLKLNGAHVRQLGCARWAGIV